MEKLYKYVYGTGESKSIYKVCEVDHVGPKAIWYLEPVDYSKNKKAKRVQVSREIIDVSLTHSGAKKMVLLTEPNPDKAKAILKDYYERVIDDCKRRIKEATDQLDILENEAFELYKVKDYGDE